MTEDKRPIVQLDLSTLTLGEMAAVEAASGRSFDQLMRGRASRLIAAMYVAALRSSGDTPSWSELSSLHLSDVASSPSPSQADGPRPRSNG
jgi:hypothetical protein